MPAMLSIGLSSIKAGETLRLRMQIAAILLLHRFHPSIYRGSYLRPFNFVSRLSPFLFSPFYSKSESRRLRLEIFSLSLSRRRRRRPGTTISFNYRFRVIQRVFTFVKIAIYENAGS